MFNKNQKLVALTLMIVTSIANANSEINIHDNTLKTNSDAVRNLLMQPTHKVVGTKSRVAGKQQNESGKTSIKKASLPVLTMKAISTPQPIENNAANWQRKVETTSIEFGQKLLKHIPVNANYDQNNKNYISANQINAIVAPVKISAFVPEPGMITFKWINQNHGIVFKLDNPRSKKFQAMVSFDNGKPPVSLVFTVANTPGRVLAIPSSIAGTTPLSQTKTFGVMSEYDQRIIKLMNIVVNNKPLSSAWQYRNNTKPNSPFKEFKVMRTQHWYNTDYSIKKIHLCSTYNGPLYLSESAFIQKSSYQAMAITLTKHKLDLGQCTDLVILSSASPVSSAGSQPANEVNQFEPSKEN